MTAGKPEGTLATLAEWLFALRPGNRCPCCGAPLKEDWPRSREPRSRESDHSETASLVCDDCGCRLEPAEGRTASGCGGVYELAA